MSKLIITGMENGKISYVEGEEVVTSVEALQDRVEELRGQISSIRSSDLNSVEAEHAENLDLISQKYTSQINELNSKMEAEIAAENERYEAEKLNIASQGELEDLEKEEAKLSLVLGSLKAKEAESAKEPLVEESEGEVEEAEAEVEAPVEETVEAESVEEDAEEAVEEVSEPVEVKPVVTSEPENSQFSPVSMPKPKRIIW